MGWSSLFEQWSATWAGFSAVGLLIFKSILDTIGNRKIRLDLTSYKTLQSSVKGEIEAYTKLLVNSVAEIKKDIIEPLVEEMRQKDYAQAVLNDVVVTLLSNVNVPLANKQEVFKQLATLNGVNKALVEKILANIEAQKEVAVVAEKTQNAVYDELKGV